MRINNTNERQLAMQLPAYNVSIDKQLIGKFGRNCLLGFDAWTKKARQLDLSWKSRFFWLFLATVGYTSAMGIAQLASVVTIVYLALAATALLSWRRKASKGDQDLKAGYYSVQKTRVARCIKQNFRLMIPNIVNLIDQFSGRQNRSIPLAVIGSTSEQHKSFKDLLAANIIQPWQGKGLEMLGKIQSLQGASRSKLQGSGDLFGDGVATDMTKCKQIDARGVSEEQLKAIFEQVSVGIAVVDLNGQFLQVNRKLCEITGYSCEELLTKTIFQLTYPEDRAVDRLYLRLLKSPLQNAKLQKRYICKTGVVIWVNVNVSVVRDPQGNPKFYIGMIEDITEGKQDLEALRCREAQLQSLIEKASDLILSSTGTIRHVSLALKQQLGYEQIDLIGQDLFQLIHREDNSKVNKFLTQMVQEPRGELLLEFRVRHQNGNWQILKAISQSVLDQSGGINIIFNSCNTEQKPTQAASIVRSRLFELAALVGGAIANSATNLALTNCALAISKQLNATGTAIWTLNPATQQLEEQVTAGVILPLDDLVKLVAQTRQPQFLQQQTPPNYLAAYPMLVEEQLLGVLAVLSDRIFSEETSDALKWAANAIANRVNSDETQLPQTINQEPTDQLSVSQASQLLEVASQIRESLELDLILETAVQSIQNLLQIERCSFVWCNQETSDWEVVQEAKNPLLDSHLGRYKMTDIGQIAQEILNHQIQRIDAVADLADPISRQFLQGLGYTSILLMPLHTEAGIGVIVCGNSTKPQPWESSEVKLLQMVVAQLTKAINHAALYQQAKVSAQLAQTQAQEREQALTELQAAQAQLVQSEKMSSLGQLVAGIAHEINNPVNFIHGNLAYASAYFYDILSLLQLYQEYYPTPAAAIVEQSEIINLNFIAKDLPKLLNSMQRGTDRIRSIVLGLRHFSRLDEADMKQADLHEGIESTLSILQHRLTAKGQYPEIQIFRDYADLPNVQCYPGQLNQVFMNILSNAIEALHQSLGENQADLSISDQPTPAITISTSFLSGSDCNNLGAPPLQKKKQNQSSVLIRIADNGPGMSELVRQKLFDPFFTTKPVGQGVGLGLSISYQIVVEHHRGFLTCTSTPGKGTEFWIEIPIQQVN